jgi:hypothetical protein
MRYAILIGFAILILASAATSVLPAFADSVDPRPGYTYFVVYRQTDGFIVYAVGCPPSPAYCKPTLQPGQSVVYITDQPELVAQFFTDAHNAKMGNWHVNTQTHQLVNTGTTGPVPPTIFGVSLLGTLLPALASGGVGTSGTLIYRRSRRGKRTPNPLP